MYKILVPYREAAKVDPYLAALLAVELEPVPSHVSEANALTHVDGLLLTGGTDVDPSRYGEPLHEKTDDPDEERDRMEWTLLEEAFQRDVPLLAICRGMQLLNVFRRGSLMQHLDSRLHKPDIQNRAQPAHAIEIVPETLLAGAIGSARTPVNSRHHQAVGRIGDGLLACAREPEESVVEALEFPERSFVLGVQWHPEDQIAVSPQAFALFRSFAEAVARGRGRK